MNIIKEFFIKIKKDHIRQYAAECSYFTLISFVPFIMFFLTTIQLININKITVYQAIKDFFPSSTQNFMINTIDEIYSKTTKTISFSLIFALWSASKGFYALSKGFKEIYKISKEKKNFIIRIEGFFFTLIFIFCIAIIMLTILLGTRIQKIILKYFFSYGIVNYFLLKIRNFVMPLLVFFLIVILYKFVPRHKKTFKSQIPGAIFSTILWIIFSYIFSICIELCDGFSNTYGSLSSIILIMMWIYFGIYIILLGAEINMVIEKINVNSIKRKIKSRLKSI